MNEKEAAWLEMVPELRTAEVLTDGFPQTLQNPPLASKLTENVSALWAPSCGVSFAAHLAKHSNAQHKRYFLSGSCLDERTV